MSDDPLWLRVQFSSLKEFLEALSDAEHAKYSFDEVQQELDDVKKKLQYDPENSQLVEQREKIYDEWLDILRSIHEKKKSILAYLESNNDDDIPAEERERVVKLYPEEFHRGPWPTLTERMLSSLKYFLKKYVTAKDEERQAIKELEKREQLLKNDPGNKKLIKDMKLSKLILLHKAGMVPLNRHHIKDLVVMCRKNQIEIPADVRRSIELTCPELVELVTLPFEDEPETDFYAYQLHVHEAVKHKKDKELYPDIYPGAPESAEDYSHIEPADAFEQLCKTVRKEWLPEYNQVRLFADEFSIKLNFSYYFALCR